MPETVPSILDLLQEYREIVDRALRDAIDSLSTDCPARLQQAMEYSLLAPGKRLRPILVLLASDACGGEIAKALPAACAIEMIHAYSLIHDDLPAMDDDDLRRGRKTCHRAFDEATAILAGDALLTLAFETMARKIRPAGIAAACCVDLASAAGAEGMVGGQCADLEGESQGIAHVEELQAIHRRKTGRLLCSAVTLGGRIAGADQAMLDRLRKFGMSIGLAFQIADDLLDVEGSADKLGKAVRKDAHLGKQTYPGFLGIEQSRTQARELVELAIESIAPLGVSGRNLQALARFVIARDH